MLKWNDKDPKKIAGGEDWNLLSHTSSPFCDRLFGGKVFLPGVACDLHVIAHNISGVPDAEPPFITVTIDHVNPDVRGFLNNE